MNMRWAPPSLTIPHVRHRTCSAACLRRSAPHPLHNPCPLQSLALTTRTLQGTPLTDLGGVKTVTTGTCDSLLDDSPHAPALDEAPVGIPCVKRGSCRPVVQTKLSNRAARSPGPFRPLRGQRGALLWSPLRRRAWVHVLDNLLGRSSGGMSSPPCGGYLRINLLHFQFLRVSVPSSRKTHVPWIENVVGVGGDRAASAVL